MRPLKPSVAQVAEGVPHEEVVVREEALRLRELLVLTSQPTRVRHASYCALAHGLTVNSFLGEIAEEALRLHAPPRADAEDLAQGPRHALPELVRCLNVSKRELFLFTPPFTPNSHRLLGRSQASCGLGAAPGVLWPATSPVTPLKHSRVTLRLAARAPFETFSGGLQRHVGEDHAGEVLREGGL